MLNNFPTPLVSTLGVVSVEREDVKLFFGTSFIVSGFREVSETGGPKVHIFFRTPFWLQSTILGARCASVYAPRNSSFVHRITQSA